MVKAWLLEQQVSYTTFLECGTKTLGLDGVPRLDKFLCDFRSKQSEPKVVETEVLSQLLFRPGTIVGLIPPDIKAQHKLLDRIICCRENFTVPIGHKGTIIGIQEKDDKWKNVYEVLFDTPFTAGLTLYESSPHKCYRLTVADFLNISFGQRYASAKPTVEKPKSGVKNAPQSKQSRNDNRPAVIPNNNNAKMKSTDHSTNLRNQRSRVENRPAVAPNNNANMKSTGHSTNSTNQPPSQVENPPAVTPVKSEKMRSTGRSNNSRNKSSQVKNRPAVASNNSVKVKSTNSVNAAPNARRSYTKKRSPSDEAGSKKNASQ